MLVREERIGASMTNRKAIASVYSVLPCAGPHAKHFIVIVSFHLLTCPIVDAVIFYILQMKTLRLREAYSLII